MPKHRSRPVLLTSTRGVKANRVFFAVFNRLRTTSVVFNTRAYMCTRVAYAGTRLRSSRRHAAVAVMVLAVAASFGIALYRPHTTDAAVSDNLNFQARLEMRDGAIAPDGNYNVEF